jgi:hypothetical protein
MIELGIILVLLVCWVFSTVTEVNKSQNSLAAFWVKSIFYWVAIGVAYAFGSMN